MKFSISFPCLLIRDGELIEVFRTPAELGRFLVGYDAKMARVTVLSDGLHLLWHSPHRCDPTLVAVGRTANEAYASYAYIQELDGFPVLEDGDYLEDAESLKRYLEVEEWGEAVVEETQRWIALLS